MGFMSAIGSSLTGNVESALLEIDDLRAAAESSGGCASMQSTASALTSGASSLAGALSAKKTFKVQFNPSELQLYASVPTLSKQNLQRSKGIRQSLSNAAIKPSVDLTVPLIFDDVNIFDAFMWDKFNGVLRGNPTAIAKSAVSLAMKATGTKWTVQTEVEGLVAALRNPYTRNITFRWANFSFTGQLHTINAQYTMFSPSGRPVRAKVNMRLHQELDPDKLQDWYTDFDNGFSGNQSTLVTNNNLLNLNLF